MDGVLNRSLSWAVAFLFTGMVYTAWFTGAIGAQEPETALKLCSLIVLCVLATITAGEGTSFGELVLYARSLMVSFFALIAAMAALGLRLGSAEFPLPVGLRFSCGILSLVMLHAFAETAAKLARSE